jgi:hypothetical protein
MVRVLTDVVQDAFCLLQAPLGLVLGLPQHPSMSISCRGSLWQQPESVLCDSPARLFEGRHPHLFAFLALTLALSATGLPFQSLQAALIITLRFLPLLKNARVFHMIALSAQPYLLFNLVHNRRLHYPSHLSLKFLVCRVVAQLGVPLDVHGHFCRFFEYSPLRVKVTYQLLEYCSKPTLNLKKNPKMNNLILV